ncbi:scavenger receptor class B member 1-like [Branchiostoma lanceolatum]|uniref:scavenger receptor class B member 1-like n=1 Tax=Branchiostoma lanceolatum TaxID=7740 RepID=UPI003453C77C
MARWVRCAGAVGLTCLVLGTLGLCLYNTLLYTFVTKMMVLQKGSFIFDFWKDIPIPIYMQFYLFDILNVDEVLKGGKPAVEQRGPYTYRGRQWDSGDRTLTGKGVIVEQRGPYTYREYRNKTSLQFNDDDTISYLNLKRYEFVPEMSVGSENDTIMTLNIPAMAISWLLKTQGTLIKDAASLALLLGGEPLFFRRTVAGLVWGYPEPLLAAAQRFAPALVKDDKFGIWLNQKTNSTDGVYTVFTGLAEPGKFAYIYQWNGMTHLPYWRRPCGKVNGTEGIMFPPIKDRDKRLYIFVSDLCRSAYLSYEGPRAVGGVPVYRYILPQEELRSGRHDPDNSCYCGDGCLQDGLIDVRSCHLGAPVVLSLPHFYLGNESLSRGVAGLRPNKMEHQIFLDVEPTTGVALAAARRTQINIIVSPVPHMRQASIKSNLIAQQL